ncbi:hypothetical protein JSE7799_00689 [Jannaschia seosinensis]|uniref:Antifreeze protein n=1 Tax=Jannaschia seosinensis TaxID=313367 RepID=A0A0M7B9P4_9RHOB|nr:hypothetical protein [Jannaschia seosinensis]CUH25305.1 hypothetical protein JSE7799_00689 [Jannaschia seosinensis]
MTFWKLQMRTAQMMLEAQTVMSLRLMGMAGILPADPGENARMVTEKQTAFAQAGLAAMGAMMAGRSPTVIYGHALTPIGRTTRANSLRLGKAKR